jgi:hypothetical protein
MDIRKADSKGRISGFQPGGHYWVDEGNGTVVLSPVIRTAPVKTPVNEEARKYLERFGIIANNAWAEGHNAEGFWAAVLDEEGRRVMDAEGYLKTWTRWPEGFDYEEFARLSWL